MTKNRPLYQPAQVTPPGETLADLLEERNMTQSELAQRMKQTESNVAEIISGQQAITPQIARQLEQVFGVFSTYWLNHEAHYRASESDRHLGKGIENA